MRKKISKTLQGWVCKKERNFVCPSDRKWQVIIKSIEDNEELIITLEEAHQLKNWLIKELQNNLTKQST